MKPRLPQKLLRQRGAATLVVVMVLFLVMALLAAYANRSMLFEQRMAASYSRASLAQEAAEGGVEWSLAQLNGTAIDAACKPIATGGQRFADRYLQINASDRSITPKSADVNGIIDCAHDSANAGWACRCPTADTAHSRSTAITDAQPSPSFNIKMSAGSRGGTLMLKVLGCTDSVPDNCAGTNATLAISQSMFAKTDVSALIGLVAAVRSPPAAPLVVRGDINSTGAGLGLHNTDPRSAGMLAMLGGSWTPGMGRVDARLESNPGTPSSQVLMQTDATLAAATAQDVFKMFMGISVGSYPQHPSLRKVTCAADCSVALEDAYKAGKRILWVEGPMAINSSKVLGSVDDPMLVIATGAVALAGSFQLNGMLVSLGDLGWVNAAGTAPRINGIVLVGGSMQTTGAVDIVYQQSVADQLRNRMGSYVRVPGGWIDMEVK
ncbi:MAG: hypothetical protein JF607_02455 [Burkholderiales bacterium]|nr:hypothetical protein [Burkholderiales bacterium]